MSQVPLRPMSTGEILDTAFGVYRRHLATLVTIVVLLTGLPIVVFGALAAMMIPTMGLESYAAIFGMLVVFVLGYVILTQLALGASVLVIGEGYLGRTLGAGEAVRRTFGRLGLLVVSALMVGLVVGLGTLLLILPGVILLCGLVLNTQVVILESPESATAALGRSWALTRDYRWRMFLLLLVAGVLTIVVIFGINLLVTVLLGVFATSGEPGATSPLVPLLVLQGIQLLANMVITPLPYCILTVAYYDLRVRKEAFDLELLATSLQPG